MPTPFVAEVIPEFKEKHEFLSNFYACRIVLNGDVYPTLEHAFQAAKTFDVRERATVRFAETPGRAKRKGRKVSLRSDWNEIEENGRPVKVNVMRDLLKQKFAPNTELGNALLATGKAMLVEGNNWGDDFWGVIDTGGENWLGKLLMEIREELRWSNWRRDTRQSPHVTATSQSGEPSTAS